MKVAAPEKPSAQGSVQTCPYCDYKWVPRVKQPVECPRCKRYLK